MAGREQALGELAINGGKKARGEPWPARALLGAEEKAAVDELFEKSMRSGQAFGYNGEPEEEYCRQFADFMGGGFADAVNSGTSAVYVALRALDPEPYSEVIVGPITDPGGIMPVPLMNCIPVVPDTAPGTFSPGPAQIEECITPRTSAIVVAHILGEPADMRGIMEVAARHHLPVVEDCAQAHCATIGGQRVGTFGEYGSFSTMFGKHYCTGGQGGVVFTKSEERGLACRRISDRGKPFGLPEGRTNVVASLNFNLNDLAAVIGSVQLRKVTDIVHRRRAFVRKTANGIEGLTTIAAPTILPEAEPSYWFWRLEVRLENLTVDKATWCKALAAEGIEFFPHYDYMPHTYEWFVKRNVFGRPGLPWTSPEYKGDRDRKFPSPNGKKATERCIALTVLETWTERESEDIVGAFTKLERAYAKGAR